MMFPKGTEIGFETEMSAFGLNFCHGLGLGLHERPLISRLNSFIGYRTCYYRTFAVGKATPAQRDAYKKARNWMDGAISMLKPGVSTDKVAKMFPKSTEIGFETEMSAFGLNFCHGLGLGLHERPLISRLNSFIEPYELKVGMVFAVETFCPAKDGVSAARIEEEVVLTPEGARIISLYPAQELPVANAY